MIHGQRWTTEGEFGRVSLEEKDIEAETIVCPEMVFGGKPIGKATMRPDECLKRLHHNTNCLKYCKAVDHIRKAHGIASAKDKTKIEYRYPTFAKKVKLICACGEEFHTQSPDRSVCMPCLIKERMEKTKSKKQLEALKLQLKKAIEVVEKNKTTKRKRW